MALFSSNAFALDRRGIQDVVQEHTDLDGYQEGVQAQRKTLRRMYSALMRHDETLGHPDLKKFFVAVDHPDPSNRGRYGKFDYMAFWDHVASEQLPRLPGVEESDGGLSFDGLDPSDVDVDDERFRPLSDLRADPRTDARNQIEDSHEPDTDAHDELLELWGHVATCGETTTAEMSTAFRLPAVGKYGDELAALPHIEREVVDPPAPDEITIDTYQDVLDAKERVESDPVEQWRYVG